MLYFQHSQRALIPKPSGTFWRKHHLSLKVSRTAKNTTSSHQLLSPLSNSSSACKGVHSDWPTAKYALILILASSLPRNQRAIQISKTYHSLLRPHWWVKPSMSTLVLAKGLVWSQTRWMARMVRSASPPDSEIPQWCMPGRYLLNMVLSRDAMGKLAAWISMCYVS